MCVVLKRLMLSKTLLILVLAGFLSVVCVPAPPAAQASISNRVQRVDIRPKNGYTRIVIGMKNIPAYTVTALTGNRLRIAIEGADGPIFKRFRLYRHTHIGRLVFYLGTEHLL